MKTHFRCPKCGGKLKPKKLNYKLLCVKCWEVFDPMECKVKKTPKKKKGGIDEQFKL